MLFTSHAGNEYIIKLITRKLNKRPGSDRAMIKMAYLVDLAESVLAL
jgi:hypothetical protein